MREAQAMAQLSHPNVIAVYDVGTFGDQVFVAMEYAEGRTLTHWLAEQKRPWREIVNIFVQTGRGLAAAHAAGILHRDFKPDNVLVGKDGRPRVLDFGLARALFGEPKKHAPDDEPAEAYANGPSNLAPLGEALTQPGRLMGTPAYMAPEQLMGQSADHRTDQYSFCVALYQALYGELPFKGQSVETLLREMSQGTAPEAASSVQVPSRLRRAVLRGLSPEPADRYPSMDALLDDLVLQSTRTRRRLWALAVLAIVTAIAIVGGIAWKKRNAAQPSIQSFAILPLKNLGDASDEATVDNLTTGLTSTVAQLSNATVISQNSASRYKTSPKSLQEIGRELSVDAIVSGSAKRSGSRIQIDTKLTSVATGRQLWTKNFENESGQLPMLQADVAAELLAQVESRRITPEQEAQLVKLRSVKPEAYEAYLKGWRLEGRGGVSNLQKSSAYFQEAIRLDPNYAPAYVGLAHTYHHDSALTKREASRLATEALMKALSLDPQFGEAHAKLAVVKLDLDFNWRAALEEGKRAIELSPNDALAHAWYSLALTRTHRPDDGIVEAKRAKQLDPLSYYTQQAIWRYFLETRQYDEGIEELRKAIELEPSRTAPHSVLAATYRAAGSYQEALAEAQKAYELSGDPLRRGEIALDLAHLGKTDEAEKIIEEIKDGAKNTDASFGVALIYSALKRKHETFKWLEYAYEARASRLFNINWNSEFAWLRSDPRFQDFVRRVDPPPYSGDADH
jgi:serine/threonine protein kinase/Tfp pilus assembly protein PilF